MSKEAQRSKCPPRCGTNISNYRQLRLTNNADGSVRLLHLVTQQLLSIVPELANHYLQYVKMRNVVQGTENWLLAQSIEGPGRYYIQLSQTVMFFEELIVVSFVGGCVWVEQ